MSLEVSGKLIAKFPTQQIKDTFSKREFVIEISDESPSGMVFTNFASFQLVNNSCSMIDNFQEGEQIKIAFNIRGNRWEKDGQVRYITNLNAWRIERVQANNATPSPEQYGGGSNNMPTSNTPPSNFTPSTTQGNDGDDLPF